MSKINSDAPQIRDLSPYAKQGRYNVYGLTVWTRPCFEVGCTKCSKLDFFDLQKRKIPFLKGFLKRKIQVSKVL